MEKNPNFVTQADGSFVPSEKLIDKVRANPAGFPNAAQDFAQVTGQTPEQVQAIIDNEDYSAYLSKKAGPIGGLVGSAIDHNINIAEGVADGVKFAGDKLGELANDAGYTQVGDALTSTGKAAGEFSEAVDPKFVTEVGTVETLTEGIAQAAPSIAAGVGVTAAAGPTAVSIGAGAAITGVVGYLTHADGDNLIQLADELSGGGVVPEALLIQEGDSDELKASKGLAGHVIGELAIVGGLGLAKRGATLSARVYKALKSGDPKLIQEVSKDVAEEANETFTNVSIKTDEVIANPESTTRVASEQLTELVEKVSKKTPQTLEASEAQVKQGAREHNLAAIVAKEKKVKLEPPVPTGAAVEKFNGHALGSLDRLVKRSFDVNSGKRGSLKEFVSSPTGRNSYVEESSRIAGILSEGDYDGALKRLNGFKTKNGADFDSTFRASTLKAIRLTVEDRFNDVVLAIRENPSITTRQAFKEVVGETHAAKLRIAEAQRQSLSSASYNLSNAKGDGYVSNITAVQKSLDEAEEIVEIFEKEGYGLEATRAEFYLAESLRLDKIGIDPTTVVESIEEAFQEFDAIRGAAIQNKKDSVLAKLTNAQRDEIEGGVVRVINDLHISALLGQISTSGLEIASNTINNALLPAFNVIGGNPLKIANWRKARTEYTGYRLGFNHAFKTFNRAYKKGKSVTDDFDAHDGFHSSRIDYDKLREGKNYITYAALRAFKLGADVSIAAGESAKALRAYSVSYSEGIEVARKAGKQGKEIRETAHKYAQSIFNDDKAITDLRTRLDVQRSSWQSVFDTRTGTGKLAQSVDNLRNSRNPFVSFPARHAIPVFRTLVNIGGDAAQYITPPFADKAVIGSLTKLGIGGKHAKNLTRFAQDASGFNGKKAQVRAQARQNIGALSFASTYAALTAFEDQGIMITGPSGFESFNAKINKYDISPPSSLIIGDVSVDLTRFLPFSAPLLVAGVVKQKEREKRLELENGDYIAENDDAFFDTYVAGLSSLSLSLLTDVSAARGIGDLVTAVLDSIESGDARGVVRFGQNSLKQYIPALPRIVGKNKGLVTGEWEQYRGETFLENVLASSGYDYGYKRLNALGDPVIDKYRGIDPFNVRTSKVAGDELYSEFTRLNLDAELGLSTPTPKRVFDNNFFKRLGRKSTLSERLFRNDSISLNKLKTKDGHNAFDVYRDLLYNVPWSGKDKKKATGQFADKISVGSIEIKVGEKYKDTLKRLIRTSEYQDLTPVARKKVWQAVNNVFAKRAKDYVADNTEIPKEFLENNKYELGLTSNPTFSEFSDRAKDAGKEAQTSIGNNRTIDDAGNARDRGHRSVDQVLDDILKKKE